jgi:condensin complex subunit 1
MILFELSLNEGLHLAVVEAVAESLDAVTNPDNFNIYRSLLKHADAVPGTVMSKLLNSISSGMLTQVEAALRDIEQEDQQSCMAHKMLLEMYAFLLQWFVIVAEKVKGSSDEDNPIPVPAPAKSRRGRGGKTATSRSATGRGAVRNEAWTWVDHIPPTLALISKVLRLKTQKIWTTTAERDNFITSVHFRVVPRSSNDNGL